MKKEQVEAVCARAIQLIDAGAPPQQVVTEVLPLIVHLVSRTEARYRAAHMAGLAAKFLGEGTYSDNLGDENNGVAAAVRLASKVLEESEKLAGVNAHDD